MDSDNRLIGWICTLVAVVCIFHVHEMSYQDELAVRSAELYVEAAEVYLESQREETKWMEERIKELEMVAEL